MKTFLLHRASIALVAFLLTAAPLYAQDTTSIPADDLDEERVSENDMRSEDLVQVVLSREDLSMLATALEAAGLAESLAGEGPYTVFAPTNEAFEQLPEGTLDQLLMPENRNQLAAILTYHVVPNAALAAGVKSMDETSTLFGEPVSVSTSGDQVMVNDANVTETDIQASNGVIHVIDTVLLPPAPMQQDQMQQDSTEMEKAPDTTGRRNQ